MNSKKDSVRLSADVIPRKYHLHLTPDLKTFTFEGQELIEIFLLKPTRSITLHARDLTIHSAGISSSNEVPRISYNEKAETMTLSFKKAIPKGVAKLAISFSGILNDSMSGFYRSSYTADGKVKYLATTQFEATDARRAFPCFDEPALKAIFCVTLTVPRECTAISNTMPVDTSRTGTCKTVRFAATPVMSTYLLAFIVGEFESIQKKSADGVLVRVFVTPGKKHQAKFALECAAKMITFFNDYFDIPYPLQVLDLIAIPDFQSGAMENWGAITYRESALLVDPVQSSTINKQWVALVIAHEIAHQWFGNLVTMQWWTHLWLNEGFASYIEYLAVDHVFPKWDIWTQFLVSDFGAALNADGLKHTHAIEVEVHHPSEIAAVFDAVSYSKGASIIRMLADYLGEKAFRDGLRLYLKKHSYKNTVTKDLWDALSATSGKQVTKIMSQWTAAEGYPVITIREGASHFEVAQTRFYSSPISKKASKDKSLWQVPIRYRIASMRDPEQFILTRATGRIERTSEWLKLNIDESGFYRSSYPTELRNRLAEPISKKLLPTRDRLGLIRDTFALSETGEVATHKALLFAQHYVEETEYVVWAEIAARLAKIHSLLASESLAEQFQSFALGLFETISKHYSWDTVAKSHSQALLKILVLGNRGRYGDRAVIEHAQRLFGSISEKHNPVPADVRGIVYDLVARYGGMSEHTKLKRLYGASQLHEEKNRIGRALGGFRQQALLQKSLAFSLSKHVRPQDTVRMIAAVTINPFGTDAAWSFIQTHWKTLFGRYSEGRELSYLLAPLEVSASTERANEIAAFIKAHPARGTERTVSQILEHIHSNAAWLKRDRDALSTFLENR